MSTDHNGLEILDRDTCVELLRTVPVGRVVTTMAAMPVALPVNFALVDGGVVFRTANGTKLHAAANGGVLGFEVDSLDDVNRTGWSVLVVGVAAHVTDPETVAVLDQLVPQPWDGATFPEFVRIDLGRVTGRRIGAGPGPV